MKYRGKARITKEFIQNLLGIPEGVEIINFSYDIPNEVLDIIVSSDGVEEKWTWMVEEGVEIPDIDPSTLDAYVVKKILQVAHDLTNNCDNETMRRLLEKEED